MVVANYSKERRDHAVAALRGCGILRPGPDQPSAGAILTFAISLLIVDDHGRAAVDDMKDAVNDPGIVQAARALLKRAVEVTD